MRRNGSMLKRKRWARQVGNKGYGTGSIANGYKCVYI